MSRILARICLVMVTLGCLGSGRSGAAFAASAVPAPAGGQRAISATMSASVSVSPPVAWGAWIPGVPGSMEPLRAMEQATGKQATIVLGYVHWSGPNSAYNPAAIQAIVQHGSVPMITWMSDDPTVGADPRTQGAYTCAQILSGRYDAYIKSWADGLRDAGGPVLLRLDHEMNGNWSAWSPGINGNTAAQYVAMWRHVHAIFAQQGAGNVRWVWSPNIEYPGATPLATLYPGDTAVDWVGLDGYNQAGVDQWHTWQSFSDIFGPSYRQVSALTAKPVMIAEVSSVEGAPGRKAAWISSALGPELSTNFPRVRALVWFDERIDGAQDYRWDSSASSLAAFTQAIAGPRFTGRLDLSGQG